MAGKVRISRGQFAYGHGYERGLPVAVLAFWRVTNWMPTSNYSLRDWTWNLDPDTHGKAEAMARKGAKPGNIGSFVQRASAAGAKNLTEVKT